MAIPSNLLPINNPLREDITEQISTITIPSIRSTGVGSNLLTMNTSDISSSFQSLAGNIPKLDSQQIPAYSLLNQLLPDSLFTTGSLDQIRNRTLGKAKTYLNGLPQLPTIPIIVKTTLISPPRIPTYGQIKNYIKNKIDRIKLQRQQASIKALNEKLKQRENPFEYRQKVKNRILENISNTRFGRYNNR